MLTIKTAFFRFVNCVRNFRNHAAHWIARLIWIKLCSIYFIIFIAILYRTFLTCFCLAHLTWLSEFKVKFKSSAVYLFLSFFFVVVVISSVCAGVQLLILCYRKIWSKNKNQNETHCKYTYSKSSKNTEIKRGHTKKNTINRFRYTLLCWIEYWCGAFSDKLEVDETRGREQQRKNISMLVCFFVIILTNSNE